MLVPRSTIYNRLWHTFSQANHPMQEQKWGTRKKSITHSLKSRHSVLINLHMHLRAADEQMVSQPITVPDTPEEKKGTLHPMPYLGLKN